MSFEIFSLQQPPKICFETLPQVADELSLEICFTLRESPLNFLQFETPEGQFSSPKKDKLKEQWTSIV